MILNFFFNKLQEKKIRLHFNEFMINFHDFVFKNKNKENVINLFVKNLKEKTQIIYFDEFQVTNIVDAMILGKLFKRIFDNDKICDLELDEYEHITGELKPILSAFKESSSKRVARMLHLFMLSFITLTSITEIIKIMNVKPWTPNIGKKDSKGVFIAACPKLNHE